MILSYTDDNVPEFKPVSAMSLFGKEIACIDRTGSAAEPRRQLVFFHFPSFWLPPNGQKGEEEN